MTFRELSKKEVIQLEKGVCLGKVDDLVIDDKTAKIEQLLILGQPRLFGLLGREEDIAIRWDEIEKIGQDALLVSTPMPADGERKPGKKPGLLGRLLGG